MTGSASCCLYGASFQQSAYGLQTCGFNLSPEMFWGGGGRLLPTLDASLCSPAEHSLCANRSEACASCQWHRTLGLQISFTLGRVWSGNRAEGLEWWTGRMGQARGMRGKQGWLGSQLSPGAYEPVKLRQVPLPLRGFVSASVEWTEAVASSCGMMDAHTACSVYM